MCPIRVSRTGRSAASPGQAAGRREDQVGDTPHARAGGTSARPRQGPHGRLRARDRIAAERATRKRAEARRRLLVAGAAVTAVLALLGALVTGKLTATPAPPGARQTQAAPPLRPQVPTVPAAPNPP